MPTPAPPISVREFTGKPGDYPLRVQAMIGIIRTEPPAMAGIEEDAVPMTDDAMRPRHPVRALPCR